MKPITFLVQVEPGEDGYYLATCPSLPGCISQGESVEDAVENVKEAIQAYTESMAREGSLDQASTRLVTVPSVLPVA